MPEVLLILWILSIVCFVLYNKYEQMRHAREEERRLRLLRERSTFGWIGDFITNKDAQNAVIGITVTAITFFAARRR